MEPATRLVFLAVLFVVSSGVVAMWQRRRGRTGGVPGVVLFTSPGCTLCGPVERALRERGVDLRVVDVTVTLATPAVRSTPTVVVTAPDGGVVMRRAGRAALDDVAAIAAAAVG